MGKAKHKTPVYLKQAARLHLATLLGISVIFTINPIVPLFYFW